MGRTCLFLKKVVSVSLFPLLVLINIAAAQDQTARGGRTADEIMRLPPAKDVTLENQQLEIDYTYEEGLLALSENDYETAEKKFAKVLRNYNRHPELNYYMALAKLGLQKMDEAVKYLRRAVRYNKYYIEARETLALVQINMGNPDVAEEQLSALQKMKPKCSSKPKCDEARLDEAIATVGTALHT